MTYGNVVPANLLDDKDFMDKLAVAYGYAPGWEPDVASLGDGSTAKYIGPDPEQPGHSIIENECGDRFTWADDEFTHINNGGN